jgi:hypothetical protein
VIDGAATLHGLVVRRSTGEAVAFARAAWDGGAVLLYQFQ